MSDRILSSQYTAQVVIDASFAAEVVYECIASTAFLQEILQKPLDVPQVSPFFRRGVLDELPPTLRFSEPRVPEGFKVILLRLYRQDRAIEETVDGVPCYTDR